MRSRGGAGPLAGPRGPGAPGASPWLSGHGQPVQWGAWRELGRGQGALGAVEVGAAPPIDSPETGLHASEGPMKAHPSTCHLLHSRDTEALGVLLNGSLSG